MKRQFIRPLVLLLAIFALYFILGIALTPRGKQASGRFGELNLAAEGVRDNMYAISSESWLPDTSLNTASNQKIYKLTLTMPDTGIAGLVVPAGAYGPDIIINGAGEIPADQDNRSVYGSLGYVAYFFDTNKPAQIQLVYYNDDTPPTVFTGSQGAAIRMLESAYVYGILCTGACIFAGVLSIAWYSLAYKRPKHIFCAIFAFFGALFFVFGKTGAAAPLFPYLSAAGAIKIWCACAAGMTAFYALVSGQLFPDNLNKWVILAFSLYCAACAVIFAVAPLSAHASVMKIFAGCTAGFLGYVFVALMSGRKEINAVWLLWTLAAAALTALIVWGLTSSSYKFEYLNPAVVTVVATAALCQWLSPAINIRRSTYSAAYGDELTEAGKIAGRLGYLKTELYNNLPDEVKAVAGDEREYASYPPRRAIGITDEEALLRDLKNITSESNRLSLLATRILQALSAAEQPTQQKAQLTKCAEKSYDIYAQMFDDKNNAVTLETDSWLPYVGADESLVMQSLFHMLNNANERTWGGTVNIYVSRGENKQSVEFKTHDDGDVIPADMIALLMSGSADAAAEPSISGLYIARSIAKNFGGDLTVVSTLRGGTTLSLILPDYREAN